MTPATLMHMRSLAFARRAWRQQRSTAVWLAAVAGAALGVMVFAGTQNLAGASWPGEIGQDAGAGIVTVHDAAGTFAPMTTYLMTMTPAILGMLVALIATLTIPGVVADDVGGGAIEALLASPIPRRRLFDAYLGAGLWMTAASWAVATVTFAGAAAFAAFAGGLDVRLTSAYTAALIVVPLSMGLWSSAATLLGALLYPGSLESKAGMNGGPIRLLAVLPGLLIVPAILLQSSWIVPMLGALLAATLTGSAVLVRVTALGFRSSKVLGA